ncbi:50S ribosomal protein L15 [Thiohalorhabdus denitrificans]|uniref:Large ribosomal subunit protein uL15 n=1 Tax=Thiohalorhabdus denitrificans TaxID=381306 RepID=A0A0N8PNA4_9GAMM|nr:50S ribosomal protein L15 [Thiohalorhabdus denitrificans]KPV40973.1 50S ribosomal protein L15 [Thiohalorhabdus denitrificans]SCY42986.1 LSU ribosomal protein L15P [Thiohalorhabdus denitrificans]
MKINELKPAPGSRKARKRVGRGESSGWGKTSAKGHKGQKARSGGSIKAGFEGGQMPLQRRLPKRGFHNRFAERYAEIRLDHLNAFEDGAEITEETLRQAGIMKTADRWAKLLGSGNLERRVTVKLSKVTGGARKAVEGAGGTVVEG